jgi:hypothetical protein
MCPVPWQTSRASVRNSQSDQEVRSDPPLARTIAAAERAPIDGCQSPRSETVAFGADCSRTYPCASEV